MEEEVLAQIDNKLNVIIKLLASKSIENKNKTDAIIKLGALGLDANLVAELVDTTPGTVYARLAEVKKKNKKANT